MKPYALLADIHLHNWSAFSTINEGGINSRLSGLLLEIVRAADTLNEAGGDRIIIAGDLFHVRGKIAPSVLNPTLDTFRSLTKAGFNITIMPGNHDLEGKDSARISAAVTALEAVGCKVLHEPYEDYGRGALDRPLRMVPWVESLEDLRKILKKLPKDKETDLILHAPVDGVLVGPMGGLSPTELDNLGFGLVFAGHYHNHKRFGNVTSIGALAHHTWSDVGTKAGFLIVKDENVDWHKSHLPEFVEMADDEDEDEFALRVPGNYVRMRVRSTKLKVLEEAREWALGLGAKGVVVISIKEPVEARAEGITVTAGTTLEASVADFIKTKFTEYQEQINKEAQMCLAEANVE